MPLRWIATPILQKTERVAHERHEARDGQGFDAAELVKPDEGGAERGEPGAGGDQHAEAPSILRFRWVSWSREQRRSHRRFERGQDEGPRPPRRQTTVSAA